MKEYNKLVRDNIPEIMLSKSVKPITRKLSDREFLLELNKKLLEEVNEYLESGETEELADILEVVFAISESKNISKEQLEKTRMEKAEKRGAFENKIFLIGEE